MALAIGIIDGGGPTERGSTKHLFSYTLCLALLAAETLALVNWFKEHRLLPLHRRRAGSEYLMLGILIGATLGSVSVLVLSILDP